jgi:hypothetical protein
VSFANKNVSGLQKYLEFQNEYNKVEIELRVVQFWTEIKLVITNRTPFDFSPNCTPLSSITIINCTLGVQLMIFVMAGNQNNKIQYGGEI